MTRSATVLPALALPAFALPAFALPAFALPAFALLAFALGACNGGQSADYQGQAPDTAVARFIPGGEVTVIQVTVSDRQPARAVELLGPQNLVIPAYAIDTQLATTTYDRPLGPSPLVGIGVGGGFGGGRSVFGSGVGLSFPIGGSSAPGSQVVSTGQIQSTALIRLPEPELYRQGWRDWKIRVRLGDPPDIAFVTLPAPPPPAGL